MGVNKGMHGFQSGCSTRLREGELASHGNGLHRKEEASSVARMDGNTLFHILEFVPSSSEEESTMEGYKSRVRDHEAKGNFSKTRQKPWKQLEQ